MMYMVQSARRLWSAGSALAWTTALAAAFALPGGALGAEAPEEDVTATSFPFEEGDVVTFDEIDQLEPFLPPEFWANRQFFFYEGMRMEIGPAYRDYSPPEVYQEATRKFAGEARIGPEGSLENYTAGQPFPMDEIACGEDPDAGVKVMWNFDYRWEGTGRAASFYYSYWDRGEELPLYFEGTSRTVELAHREEPELLEENEGDLFSSERRKYAFGIEVTDPFDSRGTNVMTYRYKSADRPPEEAKNDDTWVYVPTLRRVRRISTAQRTDAVSGTDFTLDDLFSFSGIIPQYEWKCLGEMELLAPMNSKVEAYPYNEDINFGPYGLSYADDRWELRKVVKVRMIPKNEDHPYHHKDIYLDEQTLEPLYSFAYDQKEELWKIIWHNHRWSEDGGEKYYASWEGVPEPRDLKVVSDTIVNIQTGTGNRIEFWDVDGTPLKSKGQIRRYIDVGRLTRGR